MSRAIYMTVAEIAGLLEVSKMTVYRLIHDGTLPAINAGKRSYRVRRADVAAYIKRQTVQPKEETDEQERHQNEVVEGDEGART